MCSYPTRNTKSQKNRKKIQKIRKHNHSVFSRQNMMGKAEKERKKKSFLCVSTRLGMENFKKLENTIIASFPAKIGWEWPRNRKHKKNSSDVYLPDL